MIKYTKDKNSDTTRSNFNLNTPKFQKVSMLTNLRLKFKSQKFVSPTDTF